jgi:hypothetical protein
MPKHPMIAINWYGPYFDLDSARTAATQDYGDGLYFCIGVRKYTRLNVRIAKPLYVGIAKNLRTRSHEEHHKLKMVRAEGFRLWLGEIATSEPSGRRLKVTKATLDYSEWLHARLLRLPLNDRKTKNLPRQSVTVLNRWWATDYETARKHRPHPDRPDLIDYPGDGLPARTVWFGGKQKKFSAPHYAEP